MRSEKRFYRASVCGDEGLYDKKNGCIISNVRSNIDIEENWNTVVDLLNEQQEHITHLEDTNDNFRIKLIEDIEAMEQAEKKIGEQQATIRKLQDLCGESDSENAKLRIENKQLRQSVEYWQKKYEEGTETFQINGTFEEYI